MPLIECLATNDNFELLSIESSLTVATAMDSVSLRSLDKKIGKKNIVKAINYLILRLSENFNVGKKFTDDQAATMAMDLFEVFGYETLEDVVLMFKYARQGKIGDGKDFKLDSQTVFHKWVPAYLELKSEERENQERKKKSELNNVLKFEWKKEDVDKLKVSEEKMIVGEKFGERVKKTFSTDHLEKPFTPLKDRKKFLDGMFYEAKRMSDEALKTYLLKTDNTIPGFDQDVYELVEKELDRRNKKN